jgi:hypothetical protein
MIKITEKIYKGHRILVTNEYINDKDWLFGYVELPKSNKYYGEKNLSNYTGLKAFRRLSFAGELPKEVGFFIGNTSREIQDEATSRDIEFLINECEDLVDQLLEEGLE